MGKERNKTGAANNKPFEKEINRSDTKYRIQNTEYRIQNTEYKGDKNSVITMGKQGPQFKINKKRVHAKIPVMFL